MTVLVCAICEENRKAIGKTINQAIQILGSQAKGQSEFFANIVCRDCGSRSKKFSLTYTVDTQSLMFHVSSDEDGKYTISLDEINSFLDNIKLADLNLLNIINFINAELPKTAEMNKYSIIQVGNRHAHLYCKCGNSVFKTL